MKRIFIGMIAVVALSVSGIAQKAAAWEGYLADKMCGSKWTGVKGEQRAEKHTKECALEEGCRSSGYGLVTGGKYVKFTDASDAKAVEYLEKTAPESNIYVKVTGTMDGDKLAVTSIEKAEKAPAKATKKGSMEKKMKGMKGGDTSGGCDCCDDGKEGKHAAKHGEKDHSCGTDCMKKS